MDAAVQQNSLVGGFRNSKSEARNSKLETNSNDKNPNETNDATVWILCFGFLV
jgi:hypothetical protein